MNHCQAKSIVGLNEQFELFHEDKLLDLSRQLSKLQLRHLEMQGNQFEESSKYLL